MICLNVILKKPMSRRPFRIIAAAVGGQKGGIGFRNKLPWNIPLCNIVDLHS